MNREIRTVDNGAQEGVQLAHTLVGEPVTGIQRVGSIGDNVEIATGYSTAPYVFATKDPRRCTLEGCNGWGTRTGLCGGHQRSADKAEMEAADEQD